MSLKQRLPNLRTSPAVAILLSDVHLSHNPPIARSAEESWYAAMARPLKQVCELQEELKGPAVIIAGDIFHHWKSPPELINFAIKHLPLHVYAVPGQHDLPLHRNEDIQKSAYWTLVAGQKIRNLEFGKSVDLGDMTMFGFPWESNAGKYKLQKGRINVAVLHAYCSTREHRFPGADASTSVANWKKKLKDFNVAVFGDNHKGFLVDAKHPVLLNCGTLMRRNTDEAFYAPSVGVLFANGMIDLFTLDTSEDKWIDLDESAKIMEKAMNFADLVAEFSSLGESAFDFFGSVITFLDKNGVGARIRKIILEALEKSRG